MVGTAKFTKTNNLRHLLAYSSFKNYLLVTNNCYLLPSTSNFIFNPTRFLRTKIPKEEEKNASEAEKNAQTKSFGGGFQEELIKELRKDYYYAVNPSPSAKHETLDSKKFDEIRTKVISRLIEKGKNGHLKYLGEDFRKDLVTVHKKIGMERIEKSLSSVLYFILGGLLYKLYTYYAKWNVSKAQDQFTFHLNDPAVNFDDFASAYLADSSVKQIIHYSAQKKAVALLDSEPPSAAENYMSMQSQKKMITVNLDRAGLDDWNRFRNEIIIKIDQLNKGASEKKHLLVEEYKAPPSSFRITFILLLTVVIIAMEIRRKVAIYHLKRWIKKPTSTRS
uniref:GOLD domain-containing protein n=2 Tax=Ditylenchus dipsaci TaxID=166011 RepID=A0A915DSQ2_9BILA